MATESTPPATDSPVSDAEVNKSFGNFENPNFRKLYATLSVTTMMGCNLQDIPTDGGLDGKLFPDIGSLRIKGSEDGQEKQDSSDLPPGWEKHEDDNGPYYWHIPSGTIQRDQPTFSSTKRDSMIYYEEDEAPDFTMDPNESSKLLSGPDDFVVHSMGWLEFDELLLTPATSSKAIQRCILELTSRSDSTARNWGKHDAKKLVMRIENSNLKLFDTNNKLVNLQPINAIRVWGVNDNNDFAYVARDHPPTMEEDQSFPSSPISPTAPSNLKCYVFHCEDQDGQSDVAQKIANILRDEVTRLNSQVSGPRSSSAYSPQRPQHLYIDDYNPTPIATPTVEFPTPIDEPRKTIVAKYLGCTPVLKPTGVNVLNEAIEKIKLQLSFGHDCTQPANVDQSGDQVDPLLQEKIYNTVSLVHISPSTITAENCDNGQLLLECRVRYLSFLGIGQETVKNCGFIVQATDTKFVAHCFECEPNSGVLCKTIEAACKLRYQKCLDAHKQRCTNLIGESQRSSSQPRPVSSTATLAAVKNVLSKFWK